MAIILSHFIGQNFPTMLTRPGSDNFVRLPGVLTVSLSLVLREICRVNGNDERSLHDTNRSHRLVANRTVCQRNFSKVKGE